MTQDIINEPNEKLIVKSGSNETAVIVLKRRDSAVEEWDKKVIILNRREALLLLRAIHEITSLSLRCPTVA